MIELKQMKWIRDRKPKSPGLYGAKIGNVSFEPQNFTLIYWDGEG